MNSPLCTYSFLLLTVVTVTVSGFSQASLNTFRATATRNSIGSTKLAFLSSTIQEDVIQTLTPENIPSDHHYFDPLTGEAIWNHDSHHHHDATSATKTLAKKFHMQLQMEEDSMNEGSNSVSYYFDPSTGEPLAWFM